MRIGGLKRHVGSENNGEVKVGCILNLPLRYLDGEQFMSKDVYGNVCTNTATKWQLNGMFYNNSLSAKTSIAATDNLHPSFITIRTIFFFGPQQAQSSIISSRSAGNAYGFTFPRAASTDKLYLFLYVGSWINRNYTYSNPDKILNAAVSYNGVQELAIFENITETPRAPSNTPLKWDSTPYTISYDAQSNSYLTQTLVRISIYNYDMVLNEMITRDRRSWGINTGVK